jgi:hypothetical protein
MSNDSSEVAMNYSRAGALLVLVVLFVFGSSGPASAVEVSRHPDGCRVLASTGKSEAGRDPEGRATCARVDNRLPLHVLRPPEKTHERPIDRLRSRGEGRIKATGDKAAKRELREESRARR